MLKTAVRSSPLNLLAEMQREVQCTLGACLLQIQQYEHLLKNLLAIANIEGSAETIESNGVERANHLHDKPLGVLIKDHLLKDFVVNVTHDFDEHGADSDLESLVIATGQPYFKSRHQIVMTPEKLEITSKELEEMRVTRNDMVHHFLDRFSLKTEEGCSVALTYLGTCQTTFESNFTQLSEWSASMLNTRALSASFMQSQVVQDLFDGINPNGTVDWSSSAIVQVLREAEAACGLNGWTLLNTAIAWIGKQHAEQTPSKYRCKTWRQVLKRSGQFETRTEASEVGNRNETRFQSNIKPQPQARPATAHPGH